MAVADILLTPATLYYAPVGEALPDDDVAYGTAWGGNWVNLGYTNAPLAVAYSNEKYQVMVEQLTAAVKKRITSEELAFETTLVELTGTNLALAFNGVATDTPAAVGQVGKTEVEAGGDTEVQVYTFGFEGEYVDASGDSFPVRMQIYRGTLVMGGNLEFSKSKEAGLPVRIDAEADTTKAVGKQLMIIEKVTADALT